MLRNPDFKHTDRPENPIRRFLQPDCGTGSFYRCDIEPGLRWKRWSPLEWRVEPQCSASGTRSAYLPRASLCRLRPLARYLQQMRLRKQRLQRLASEAHKAPFTQLLPAGELHLVEDLGLRRVRNFHEPKQL